jgi:predicted transcriptional regulator
MYKNYLVFENATLEQVIKIILTNSKRTVMVISKNKKIIGTISEGDILRSILKKKNMSAPASKIMNKSFKYLIDKKDTKKAKAIFIKYNVNILPIINKNFKLLSVVTLSDLFNINE